ncbi:hypothetical protein D3C87_2172450 [compost metagenome]
MRQVCTQQNDITRFKMFDAIADKLRAITFIEIDQFDFLVVMPFIIDRRLQILPNAK